jgi:hypothetical protein
MNRPADNGWIRPGLVATLYGEPGKLQVLAGELAAAQALEPDPGAAGVWQSAKEDLWLQLFEPPTNGDTAALQVACNPPEETAATGWLSARARLEQVLDPPILDEFAGGCTLLYLAEAGPGAGPDEAGVLGPAVPLHSDLLRAYPLRRSALGEDGTLWLTHIPVRDDRLGVIVYAAVARSGREAALNRRLLGRTAPFLMSDLVAHKGYRWRREYDASPRLRLADQTIAALAEDTTEILDDLHDEQKAAAELEEMASRYDEVVGLVPQLDEIRYNLVKQQINFDQWTADLPGEEIFSLHRSHLRLAVTELELLLTRARDTLQVAGTTVELVQARQGRERARRERRTQQLLTLLALALALPELINMEAAGAFLGWLARRSAALVEPAGGYSAGILFWTQVGLIVVIGAIFFLAGRVLLWRR